MTFAPTPKSSKSTGLIFQGVFNAPFFSCKEVFGSGSVFICCFSAIICRPIPVNGRAPKNSRNSILVYGNYHARRCICFSVQSYFFSNLASGGNTLYRNHHYLFVNLVITISPLPVDFFQNSFCIVLYCLLGQLSKWPLCKSRI